MTGRYGNRAGLHSLAQAIHRAIAESKLAYQFSADSYSFAAMNACIAAERALEVLREALEAEAET
jgi:hypothetical protein